MLQKFGGFWNYIVRIRYLRKPYPENLAFIADNLIY